jgi:hypothetical protein
MEMKLGMVPIKDIVDSYSGVRLMDTGKTIQERLNQAELERYVKAINKVETGQRLNLKDLKVLDKIDEITFEKHGMCLKDSNVTKARIKASKKYGIEFIDRDGLIDHMNEIFGFQKQEVSLAEEVENELLSDIFSSFGKDRFQDFTNAIERIMAGIDLDVSDAIVLVEIDSFAREKFGISILNHQVQSAIDRTCDEHDVAFAVMSEDAIH